MKTSLWRIVLVGLKTGGRSGAILGMVLVIVLALSMVGVGLLNLGQVNGVEVSRNYNLSRAFWAAEAGVYHAKAMLRASSGFRASPSSLSGGSLGYSVTTTSEGSEVYTIRSTGTLFAASRVVWQTVFAGERRPPAFDYALFGGSGDMNLRRQPYISGDVFQNGDIAFNPPATVTNGTVSVASTNDTISPSTLPASTPTPVPTFPVFDSGPSGAGYDGLIATAAASGTLTNSVGNLNLGGGTNYVNSANLTINGNITGPGVLVVSGDVTLSTVMGGTMTLNHDIHIISGGTLNLDCSTCTAGTNCLMYSKIAINASKDVVIGTVTLITSGDVGSTSGGLQKNLTLTGMLYAGGTINSKKDLTVTGSVLAGGGMDIAKNCTVNYADLFPVPMIPGFTPVVVVTNIVWKEVF